MLNHAITSCVIIGHYWPTGVFPLASSFTVNTVMLVYTVQCYVLALVTNQPIILVQVGKCAYYSSIILTKIKSLLCSKLCWHNLPRPRTWTLEIIRHLSVRRSKKKCSACVCTAPCIYLFENEAGTNIG